MKLLIAVLAAGTLSLDVKTVQELLRHANSRITLDVYTPAVNSTKRTEQSKVVRMMLPDLGTKEAGGDIESA